MDENDIFRINGDDNNGKKETPFEKKYLIGVTIVAVILILAMTGIGIFIGYSIANKSSQSFVETHPVINITGVASDGMLSVQDVTERVEDSIVMITVESRGAISRGSGVIIREDGYIITNAHVVSNATSVGDIKVSLSNGNDYTARDYKVDEMMDIALVKISSTEQLHAAVVGDSSTLKKGQPVVVIGHPLGTPGGSVTDGVLSALDKSIIIENRPMKLLQTNAAINPGNSGGGMFDRNCNLIGIVNAKSAAVEVEGMGFAIPINDAYAVAKELKEHGYVTGRIDLGFSTVNINNVGDAFTVFMDDIIAGTFVDNGPGVYVYNVDDSLSDKIRKGDKIVAINDLRVKSLAELNIELQKYKVGDTVKFTFARDKMINITLKLQERKG